MRHIREILRLKWTLRRSHRETARSLGISAGAVASVVTRAQATGLNWDTVGALSDDALERTLYGPKLALTVARPGPDLVGMQRNETFFTLAALNARIAELLTDLNDRPMKGYGGASRRTLFERFDRPAVVKELPSVLTVRRRSGHP